MDIRLRDIRLGKTPIVTLHGKGGKTRVVPLQEITASHFQNYVRAFHPDENPYSEQYVFYVIRHGRQNKMHHDTARRLICDYGVAAKKHCPEVPDNVHPHLWQHTRAMHLYQHGVDLTLISQWLGHVKPETTLIYAKADTEQKRRAMASANQSGPLAGKLNSERFTVTDDEMVKRLYGLR